MNLNDETRTRLLIPMTLSIDPTDTTVELSIDGVWHPCVWLDTPVQTGTKWTQTARTTGYFAGPNATPDDATVLATGRHLTETRVTWTGGDTIVSGAGAVNVA